ncbi:MAG: fatty acid desaturase [Ilumatobacteraceae bacterium]
MSTPQTRASAVHLSASWSLYVLLALVALRAPWVVRIPAWFAMGWLLLGNGAIVHEAAHRHLFKSASANRVTGAVAGAVVLLPWGVYRPYHLSHHRYTVAIEDPEGPPLQFHSRFEYPLLALGGIAFLVRLLGYGIATVVGRPPPWLRSSKQRRAAVVDTLLCLAVLAAVVRLAFANLHVVTTVWLVPWVIALLIVVPLVLVTEHYGATVGTVEAAENTRTIVSNGVVRWMYWNNNFHTAHHQLPTVVYQSLPELDEMIGGDRLGPWVSPGYLAFHRGVWHSLPWLDRTHHDPAM